MAKRQYGQVAAHLERSDREPILVSFADVEEWIGGSLPDSARKFQSWWGGYSALWRLDGWRATPDLDTQTVLFRRRGKPSSVAEEALLEAVPPKSLGVQAGVGSWTEKEQRYLDTMTAKLIELHALFTEQELPSSQSSASDWYEFLERMKMVQGNPNNDMSFAGCLLAKEYLKSHFDFSSMDVAEKAQGASGLDIDAMTAGGERVIGEVKTTKTYGQKDFGAAQKASFEMDFLKLAQAQADHKFLFLTHASAFAVIKRRYGSRLPGVTVVLLTTAEEWREGEVVPLVVTSRPAPEPELSGVISSGEDRTTMGQREEVLEYIKSNKPQCDDCISERLGYSHRQTVNAIARKHRDDGLIKRHKATCALCKMNKEVNVSI